MRRGGGGAERSECHLILACMAMVLRDVSGRGGRADSPAGGN